MGAHALSRTIDAATTRRGADDEARVRALLADWARAIEREEMDGVLARHADDIVLFDVAPPFQADGIEAYRRAWELFFSFQGQGVFDVGGLTYVVGDEAAFCHGIVRVGPKDERAQFDVHLTVGFRKIAGDWVVTHEHHSVPPE